MDGARGAVEPPIRSEIFGPQRFAQHGRSLGATHRATLARGWGGSFFPRLRDNIQALREAHAYIGLQASTGYDISPAAEWLLDNFHLIEAQLQEIHEGLPRSYFRALPILQDPPLAGLPRVYGIAWAFVAHTDGAFDEALLVQFLVAYQETRELKLSEMWALPTTLRVVLVENLRRLAERVATTKAAREVANLCCDNIAATSVSTLDALLAWMQQRGVGQVFLVQVAQRFQDQRTGAEASHLEWLQRSMPDPASFLQQQPIDQAADNLSVSNAVTSLRAIGGADWPDIVARTSTLMQLMRSSPVFEAEDLGTRDQTLHAIERLARASGRGEVAVAESLLALMRAGAGDTAVASHWLRGSGRPVLVHALGMSDSRAIAWRDAWRRMVVPVYLGTLALGTAGLVSWMLLGPTAPRLEPAWLTLLGVLLMLFPASEAVVAVINRLISESVRPRHLPRLALAEGIPIEHRVLVVIPGMLSSAATVQALAHRLELHFLANPERQAQFALLSDWVDADAEHIDGDASLLDDACARIRTLNTRHPAQAGDPLRFIVLHRGRSFSPTEQRWIGWERKRGKLERLITALATGKREPFLDRGEETRIAQAIRYIVTLDSDTQLPPGRLRELVGVAAHPHNHPRVDAATRSVVKGYGILQPHIASPLPDRRDFTLFHWLFAGQGGIDPYSAATSEVYQDLFSEGSFTGKGLLHVQALHAVLSARLPDGQVLSHDLLEGAIARCATVTDVTVIEDAPFHADVAASRMHRWIRGDWQLLPFLLRPHTYHLRTINRWKMFDNLRRSLVPPMSLALLVLSLAGLVASPWEALALILAAFSAGPLMGAVAGFSPSRDDVAKRHFYRQAATGLARMVSGALWHLAQLLQQAFLSLDAIVRSLYRMGWSRKHLLQWTTAETAQSRARTTLPGLLRMHWREPLAAAVLLTALLLVATPHPVAAALLCLLWGASPLWTWFVSRPCPGRDDARLPEPDRATLQAVARDTWGFFERCVGAQDNHLPPDNLQTVPYDMVAHRTSPTNIGLYLLSVACARAFGWIGMAEMLSRMESTLATLQRLQRHRGHFLNWYDTQSCAPLLPMYVSTVDSGNLCGHLLAVAQACLERCTSDAGASPEAVARLQALARAFEQLAWEAEFGFLYDPRRHLFHIGYRVAEQQLDAGYYDLLASESRLTSLWAIAKGDVPVRHWAALGRPFFAVGALAGLRSWSGSMFEYLMPGLVLQEPYGSALQGACRAAVVEQMAFAAKLGVPWGMSESAYAASDHTLAYQYAPQGVPRLALRRTPPDELVIAPYATVLAAQVAPRDALVNLAVLQGMVPRTALGFIEALDFTASRQGGGEAFTPVSTFMAHHQGMSLVALANLLLDGVAQRWGMANPAIEAVASLLHERAPREVSVLFEPQRERAARSQRRRAAGLLREVVPGAQAVEPTHVLSNGRYSVTLRPNGAGWSRLGQTGITRSRDDALRDLCGSFVYLRWPEPARAAGAARLASITQHPAPDPQARYHSTYHADRVCFDARWPELQAHTTVWVSPEDDIEFRQIELQNLGEKPLDIELLSAFEVTLADPRADASHPAFSNLFVRCEWHAQQQALVFARTPRLVTEQGLMAAHFLADVQAQVRGVSVQADRQRWLGRNHAPSAPLAQFDPEPVTFVHAAASDPDPGRVTLRTGLDPVCALAVRLHIAPGGKAQVTFATVASADSGTLHAVIDKYRQSSHVQRASLMSATLASIRLRSMRISSENFGAIQSLTTALVLGLSRAPANGTEVSVDLCDRRVLWHLGISGDRPLLLVWAAAIEGLGLLRVMVQALRLWAWGSIACDLVVVNSEPASYDMGLQREINGLRERFLSDTGAQAGAAQAQLHVLRAPDLSPDELSTLRSVARLQLHADGRPFLHHVAHWCGWHQKALEQRLASASTALTVTRASAVPPPPQGAFDAESGDFRFHAGDTLRPLRPWVNVLANPGFGAQLSEAGGGYTWALNSRLMQLTGWSNDPVADPPSEWFLLQDRRTLEAWSVTPGAWGCAGVTYEVSHGQGLSTVAHRRGDAEVTASWCVDAKRALKQVRVRIVNRGSRSLHLRLVGMVEWVMGGGRDARRTTRSARHDTAAGTTLLCTQVERADGFGGATAFLAVAPRAGDAPDWSCDRREWFDATGSLVLPDVLGQRQGAGLDPSAALAVRIHLEAGAAVEHVFLLGFGEDAPAALALADAAVQVSADARLAAVRHHWDLLLGATQVRTPDPLFDALVNRWLLYQNVACRLWAKAGFYQAGGAIGFRDQLQDAMALGWAAPEMLRAQILTAAARQFPEGDVQHWWHAPEGAGVRTRFSDDLLWLPYVSLHYLQTTGDATVLDETLAFIEGPEIPEGAEDAYYVPVVGTQMASVFEHAARAIDRSLRVGAHGLPLMGSGDWNDGMNRVGIEGRGESVWLGWFLCAVVAGYAPLARARGEVARADAWEAAAAGWKAALAGPGWDGQWYRRAFFDDGQVLGSAANPEARIDLIAQAWSVLSHAAPAAQAHKAMAAAEVQLMDRTAGLIRLLDPPLAHAVPSAGYIQAYPPGVRENGGQYSHAGVWALMAQAEQALHDPKAAAGAGDLPWRSFTWLSPAHRAADRVHGAVYGLEPYVMAGDVYSQPPYTGRGGWSWYTGSAAWMHRGAIESLFGLHQGPTELYFTPCLPSHWPRAELTLKREGRQWRFVLWQGPAHEALAAVGIADARLLLPEQRLAWHDCAPAACFVVPWERSR